MKLIPKERRALIWKSISTWIAMAHAILVSTWGAMPDDLKTYLPEWFLVPFSVVFIVLFIAAKYVAQFPLELKEPKE